MSYFRDLNLLNTLVVIADSGSLSAAAPRLCRSQSAISEQVKKLEEICGLPLLERSKTGTKLTTAGERLVGHARQLLSLSDAAYRDIQGRQLAGDLRLAITDYFRPNVLPNILKYIRDAFPRLHLSVSIRKSALIEEANSRDFDIGLSMAILSDDGQCLYKQDGRRRLHREPLYWVAGSSFIPSEHDILPLVILPNTCSLQRFAIKKLKENHIPYRIAHSASGIGGLHLALQAGLGVACLNESAIPNGIVPFTKGAKLPILPEVEFSLVPPRESEMSFVADVRNMLAEQLTQV